MDCNFNTAIIIILCIQWLFYADCTHVFTLDEDFSRINTDEGVRSYASEILKKLNTFTIKVHPRIRLFYKILKRKMSQYAHENSDTLYNPYVYKEMNEAKNNYS